MLPFDLRLYQIVVVAIAVVMIYQGVSGFVRGETGKTFLKLLTRIAVWGGMAAISLFPSLSGHLARLIGIQGNVNAAILIGFLLVFSIIFKLLAAIERLERQITELLRKEALAPVVREMEEENTAEESVPNGDAG